MVVLKEKAQACLESGRCSKMGVHLSEFMLSGKKWVQ